MEMRSDWSEVQEGCSRPQGFLLALLRTYEEMHLQSYALKKVSSFIDET